MDPVSSGDLSSAPPPLEPPVATPIAGWSNWVTFHDVCRECGRRVTGFVCDSGRMTRLQGGRWAVEMQWQHDGEGAVECGIAPGDRGQWPRSATTGPGRTP